MTTPLLIPMLKAYGDLAIAATALEQVIDGRPCELLVGSHLLPLASALCMTVPWRPLDLADNDVPAMYDVRRRGRLPALNSVAHVRNRLASARRRSELVFDRTGVREWMLALPRRPVRMPRRENVYLGYHALAGAATIAGHAAPPLSTDPVIGIFPGSRVAAKNMPAALVTAIAAICEAQGSRSRIVLLDGERPDLQRSHLPHQVVPHSFAAMIAAVAGCDRVISADSLPAHLAERAGRPVFVLSPVPNPFWLPLSAFRRNHHGLFRDGVIDPALRRFAEMPNAGTAISSVCDRVQDRT